MSFKNPQRVINKQFDAYISGGQALTNKINVTTDQMRRTVASQKRLQLQMQDRQDQEMQSMYSKVNEFGSSTNAEMDQNLHEFWNHKADEYFKIKNAMQDGIIGRQEGNKALANINNLIPQFGPQVKMLAEESASYHQDVIDNNVSSVGSNENKIMLQRIHDGGNVQIVEKNGKLFYFSPEEKDEEGNIISEAAMINGSELTAAINSPEGLYQKKAKIGGVLETVFNEVVKPDDLNGPGYVEWKENVVKGDINPATGFPYQGLETGNIYTFKTIPETKKAEAIDALSSSPAITNIMNNEMQMRKVWQDDIPDEEIERIAEIKGFDTSLYQDPWHEFADNVDEATIAKIKDEQSQIMKTYLAEKAYNDNATMDSTLKFVKKEPYNPNKENPTTGEPYYMNTVESVYDFVNNPVDNANLIINHEIKGKTIDNIKTNYVMEDNGMGYMQFKLDSDGNKIPSGTLTLQHKDYSLDQGSDGKEVNKYTDVFTFNPKDPQSTATLAMALQKDIGGNNKDNNEATQAMLKLYPEYAEKMKLEKLAADEAAKGNGGFGNFLDDDSYITWKTTNGLDELSDVEIELLRNDKEFKKVMSNEFQERPGFKSYMASEVEHRLLVNILEQRNAVKAVKGK